MTEKPSFGNLTKIAEAKDDLDKFIINRIAMNFGMQLTDALNFEKKQKEKFLDAILSHFSALLKANEAKRDYLKKEKKLIEQFKMQAKKDANKNITLGERPIELLSQSDSFFTQIKSAFDYLAQTLNPILNLSVDAWHRGSYKKTTKSGVRILNALNNFSDKDKQKLKELIDLIENSLDWITYLVEIRDNPVHRGVGIVKGNVIEMRITKSENKISNLQPLCIRHPSNIIENLGIFLDRTIHDTVEFSNAFLYYAIQFKSYPELVLQLTKDKNGNDYYCWVIPEHLIKNK